VQKFDPVTLCAIFRDNCNMQEDKLLAKKAVNGVVKMAGIATTTLLMVQQQDLFMG
jgi:hypothetical protein